MTHLKLLFSVFCSSAIDDADCWHPTVSELAPLHLTYHHNEARRELRLNSSWVWNTALFVTWPGLVINSLERQWKWNLSRRPSPEWTDGQKTGLTLTKMILLARRLSIFTKPKAKTPFGVKVEEDEEGMIGKGREAWMNVWRIPGKGREGQGLSQSFSRQFERDIRSAEIRFGDLRLMMVIGCYIS